MPYSCIGATMRIAFKTAMVKPNETDLKSNSKYSSIVKTISLVYPEFISTVRLNKKVYTFSKSPHINISKYFQEIFIHGSLLSNDTKNSDDIVCLSEQEPRL